MKLSLALCQRRRPVADPIPAFVEQLKAYEKECRQFGHLTAVDSSKPSIGPSSDGSGGKRKAESESSSSDGKSGKKRAVGPSIGPPIGPSIPTKGARVVGPTLKQDSTEKKGIESKHAHDEGGVKDKASSAADKKKKIIGPERPPVKAICPMKPPQL